MIIVNIMIMMIWE